MSKRNVESNEKIVFSEVYIYYTFYREDGKQKIDYC